MSVRSRYVVSYDICDDRRLRAIYKAMRGFGDHLQYSVFRCDLSRRERVEMIAALHALMDHSVDQVLVIDLGPTEGRAADCIEANRSPLYEPRAGRYRHLGQCGSMKQQRGALAAPQADTWCAARLRTA